MQADAVKLIQETALAAQSARVLEVNDRRMYIGSDNRLIDLEEYEANRVRFRGIYKTNSTNDFISHVHDRSREEGKPHVFIDAETFEAEAIYNYGDFENPGHCDDKASLKIKKTAAFSALLAVDGRAYSQQTIVNFLEDWATCLMAIDSTATPMNLVSAITAIRNITIKQAGETKHEISNFGQTKSAFEKIDASSNLLPDGFQFQCIPYNGLPDYTFTVRFDVMTGNDEPLCVLRIVQKEAALEQITQDYKKILSDGIGEQAKVYIGTFSP